MIHNNVCTKEDRTLVKNNNGADSTHFSQELLEAFERCVESGIAERRYMDHAVLRGEYQIKYLLDV